MSDSIPPYAPELIEELEISIGVTKGFFSKIIHEDDWSFIIKLHGMIDAGLTQIILEYFGDSRLDEPISRMNIQGGSGKLAFVRHLELLPKHNINFIQKLTEIRNVVVHRIANTSFSIDAHIRSFSPQQMKDFVTACGDGIIPESLDFETPFEEQKIKVLLKDPRTSFWWSSVWVLGNLTKSKKFHQASRRIKEIESEIGRKIIDKK